MNQQLGPYQLVERLGVGGMAEVFLAEVTREGDFLQTCVIKVLHPQLADDADFSGMLAEEAKLVAQLRHNNIASLYNVGRHEGKMFLVMEHVNGQDLHAILANAARAEKRLPIPFAVHVAKQVCAGLHFAHTRRGSDGKPLNLVHRDISPPNILLSTLGEVKIIDFGVAKFNSEAREKTRAGVIKGKFGYMSPEQAWDEDLDQRSDLFSVGICLYEMLTGRSLYGQSDDVLTMVRRAREADIDPVQEWRPDVGEELARVVHKALEPNRDARYQSAHALERELSVILAREAADYTALDAGGFVDELFDTREPALASRSPRLAIDPELPEATLQHRSLEQNTEPLTDVPDPVHDSGRIAELDPSEVRFIEDESDPALATNELELDDFSEEKTELFQDHRISDSGPLPVERGQRTGAPSANGADPNRETRLIEDGQWTDNPPVPEADEPHPIRQSAPHLQPNTSAPRQSPAVGGPNDGEPAPEPRRGKEAIATGPSDVLDIDAIARPKNKHKVTADLPTYPKGDEGSLSDKERLTRRLQIAGALVFVLLAVLFVIMQVRC